MEAITEAVNFTTAATAIIAIAVTYAIALAVRKGAEMVLAMLK